MLLEKKKPPTQEARPRPLSPSAAQPEKSSFKAPSLSGSWLVLLAGLLVAGLWFQKAKLGAAWREQADQFKTVVLLSGSEIEIDEIGAVIRRAPFVKSVRLISQEEGLLRLVQNPLFSDKLGGVDPSLIPLSWEIEWQFADGLTQNYLNDFQNDMRAFPAVLTTGIDWSRFSVISHLRTAWLNIRLFSSLLLFFSAAVALLFIGRNLFFREPSGLSGKAVLFILAVDSAAWAIGVYAISAILGPVNPHLFWGGPILALIHGTFLFSRPALPHKIP